MKTYISNNENNRKILRFALIPILGLMLVAVLFWPKAEKQTNHAAPDAHSILVSKRLSSPLLEPAKFQWPTVNINEVIAFDPFDPARAQAIGEIAADATGGNVESGLNENSMQQSSLGKLQAVYIDAFGATAILDSRVVHVGDHLPGFGRVVTITGREIVVEKD